MDDGIGKVEVSLLVACDSSGVEGNGSSQRDKFAIPAGETYNILMGSYEGRDNGLLSIE